MNISGNGRNSLLDGFIINALTTSEFRSLMCGIRCMNFQRNKKCFVYVSFEGTENTRETLENSVESGEETVACCCCSHRCPMLISKTYTCVCITG